MTTKREKEREREKKRRFIKTSASDALSFNRPRQNASLTRMCSARMTYLSRKVPFRRRQMVNQRSTPCLNFVIFFLRFYHFYITPPLLRWRRKSRLHSDRVNYVKARRSVNKQRAGRKKSAPPVGQCPLTRICETKRNGPTRSDNDQLKR